MSLDSEDTLRPIHTAFTVPLEPLELQWIGTLTVIWAHLEYCVEAAIYRLQGLSDVEGRAMELPRDLSRKANKLSAIAGDHCKGAERRAFQDLCARIVAVAPLRNLVVHGWWVYRSDRDNEPSAVSWFKVPVGEPVQWVSRSQLPDITAEAGLISRALYDLLVARGAFVVMAE